MIGLAGFFWVPPKKWFCLWAAAWCLGERFHQTFGVSLDMEQGSTEGWWCALLDHRKPWIHWREELVQSWCILQVQVPKIWRSSFRIAHGRMCLCCGGRNDHPFSGFRGGGQHIQTFGGACYTSSAFPPLWHMTAPFVGKGPFLGSLGALVPGFPLDNSPRHWWHHSCNQLGQNLRTQLGHLWYQKWCQEWRVESQSISWWRSCT